MITSRLEVFDSASGAQADGSQCRPDPAGFRRFAIAVGFASLAAARCAIAEAVPWQGNGLLPLRQRMADYQRTLSNLD